MEKTYNSPVTMQIYLGCGKKAKRLRENIIVLAAKKSVSSYVLQLLKIAEPYLFEGVNNESQTK